jgi:hypothetical protein
MDSAHRRAVDRSAIPLAPGVDAEITIPRDAAHVARRGAETSSGVCTGHVRYDMYPNIGRTSRTSPKKLSHRRRTHQGHILSPLEAIPDRLPFVVDPNFAGE